MDPPQLTAGPPPPPAPPWRCPWLCKEPDGFCRQSQGRALPPHTGAGTTLEGGTGGVLTAQLGLPPEPCLPTWPGEKYMLGESPPKTKLSHSSGTLFERQIIGFGVLHFQ